VLRDGLPTDVGAGAEPRDRLGSVRGQTTQNPESSPVPERREDRGGTRRGARRPSRHEPPLSSPARPTPGRSPRERS
jgi:hypothetical protein